MYSIIYAREKIQYLKKVLVLNQMQHKNLIYKTIRIIRKDKKTLTIV